MGSSDGSSGRGRRSKVARLLEKYDLQGLGPELEQLWTADENRQSLRELEDYFNRQLLRKALTEAEVKLLDGEMENIYRLLTDEEVSSADRTRVRRRLEREGISVDDLESDFVTYQAVRFYLKDYRDAEYTPDVTDPIERQRTSIQELRGRMTSVTESKLEQLCDNDEITLGNFRTLANITVICEECSAQLDVLDLLKWGECECTDNFE
jgi:hypothetical protein